MNWLRKHFQRYRERTAWEFCWRIAIEGTILSFLSAFILSLILVEAEREFPDWGAATVFLFLVVIAPLAETLLLQAFPIFIARKLNASFNSQIILSTTIFTACHFLEGIATGISAGVIGGFYFAFTYAHWRQKSRWTAFWVTAVSHSIHNGICFVLLALLGGFK